MAQRLVVLHVIESLGHGGAEQNLVSLLRRLPAERFEHHLAWLYPDERLRPLLAPLCTSLTDLGARGPLGHLGALVRLTRRLSVLKPNVIHVQLLRAQLLTRLAALLSRREHVVTTWQNATYDDDALGDFRGSAHLRKLFALADRWTSQRDARFIAVSEHVAAHLSAMLAIPREQISVIYNSVEPDRYALVDAAQLANKRAQLGLAADAKILLAVGRRSPQKGHIDAIFALPTVLQKFPTAQLLIAGASGVADADLQAAIAELRLGEHVQLLGVRDDVPALYQLADAFVFPSRYEGLSVALVEALVNGLPAAVSAIPQNLEVVAQIPTVRLVAPGDVAGLARALISLLESDQRTAARTAGEPLKQKFSPARLAARYGETFEQAART